MDRNQSPTTRRPRDIRHPGSGIEITPLKERILAAALLCRAFRGDQLSPLVATAKVRNAILRNSYDHGYLDRSFPSLSPFCAPVYHVGRKGVPVAVAALAAEGTELSADDLAATVRKPPLTQLAHALAITDVYSALVLRGGPVRGFLPEAAVRIEYEARAGGSGTWRPRCFAPDGALIIAAPDGAESAMFLEVDMGTVAIERFRAKCQSFAQVCTSGLADQRLGMPAPALAVATITGRRLSRLMAAACDSGARNVLLATLDDIRGDGPDTMWTASGSGDRTTIAEFVRKEGTGL